MCIFFATCFFFQAIIRSPFYPSFFQETRIGKRMNLMRKNIEPKNKDLAKRVKNLLKKWKKDMEKLKVRGTNNGLVNERHSTPSQPTKKNNLQHQRNYMDKNNANVPGTKRKLADAQSNDMSIKRTKQIRPHVSSPCVSLTQKQQSSPMRTNSASPRLVHGNSKVPMPARGQSPKPPQQSTTNKAISRPSTASPVNNKSITLNHVSSPKMSSKQMSRNSTASPVNQTSKVGVSSSKLSSTNKKPSHGNDSLIKKGRNTPSPLVTNTNIRSNHTDKILTNNELIKNRVGNDSRKEQFVNSKYLNTSESLITSESSSNGFDKAKHSNSGDHFDSVNRVQLNDSSKDTDTRVQEDRIHSIDSGYQGTLSNDENSPSLSPDEKLFMPIDSLITNVVNAKTIAEDVIPDHFDDIEEEELHVTRKDFTDDPSSPNVHADGVNGNYDSDGRFCDWTEEIARKDYSILPYVILD